MQAIGANDIKQLFTTLYEQSGLKMIYGLTDLDLLKQHFPATDYAPHPSRMEARLPSKLVYTCDRGHILAASDGAHNRESRWIPEFLFIDFTIIGEYVAFASFRNNVPVVVAVRDTQGLFRQDFDRLWDRAAEFTTPQLTNSWVVA